jgi:heme/copper-type cytochrome/quinol oxidase subunit 2
MILEISNFWFYTIMVVVILHVLVAFGYLLFKLSPKKKDKHKDE